MALRGRTMSDRDRSPAIPGSAREIGSASDPIFGLRPAVMTPGMSPLSALRPKRWKGDLPVRPGFSNTATQSRRLQARYELAASQCGRPGENNQPPKLSGSGIS